MKIRVGFVSNSSSEAFICATNKSLYIIEEGLKLLLDTWNKLSCEDLKYDEVFEVGMGNKAMFSGWADTYSIPHDIEKRVVIESVNDNVIPYELFGIIEDVYKADRLHLG